MHGDARPYLVVDANVAIATAERDAFSRLTDAWQLLAPRIFWSEVSSVLHRMAARRSVDYDGIERQVFERILRAPIELVDDFARDDPWSIASLLGWPKTYDAEYLAAARHRGAGLFSLDQQLRSGADRIRIPIVIPN